MTDKKSSAKTILKDIIVLMGLLGGQIIAVLFDIGILRNNIFMWISVALFVISVFVILFIHKKNPFEELFPYERDASWLQRYACNYRLRLYILSAMWLSYLYCFSRSFHYETYYSLYQTIGFAFAALIIIIAAMEVVLIIMRKKEKIYDPVISDNNSKEEYKGYTFLRVGYILMASLFIFGSIFAIIYVKING